MAGGSPSRSLVSIVEDDDAMRGALGGLLGMCGYEVRAYDCAGAFIDDLSEELTGCVVLDVRMPEIDGLAFQRRLSDMASGVPIIFISGYADVALSVKAMRQGAFTFLTKPFRDQDLLDAVAEAVRIERETRPHRQERQRILAAYAALDDRERDVLGAVTHGEQNKVIAARLNLSEITIKVVRAGIMRKLQATSIAQLARLAERHGLA